MAESSLLNYYGIRVGRYAAYLLSDTFTRLLSICLLDGSSSICAPLSLREC
ncbi:hypothetical protein VPNG_05980 [Cytospora leucostoma]|uniref:Uncharacterized protein n=1 Tax=Cytospora leucostoma TaxID=1230097 RepID=A0A423XAV1_9PEZI|nr:hypothetical protein VPNG_05980 [Cytospora leucostoma]